MRRSDSARRKQSRKHGADWQRHDANVDALVAPEPNLDLLALDEALKRLAEHDPVKAKLVELRYFGGLSIEETADVLNISHATVERSWKFARAWLRTQLSQ